MIGFKSENNIFFGIIFVLITIISFLILGFTGLRTILGLLVIMFLPFYFIFNNFNLSISEKVVFSFFVSIMLFPSLVYFLGFIIPFKIAIFVVFILSIASGFIIKRFRKA